jgi:hypothetical protein
MDPSCCVGDDPSARRGKALMLERELRKGRTIGWSWTRGKRNDNLFCDFFGMPPQPTPPPPSSHQGRRRGPDVTPSGTRRLRRRTTGAWRRAPSVGPATGSRRSATSCSRGCAGCEARIPAAVLAQAGGSEEAFRNLISAATRSIVL